mmetsp:Transcript_30599/g.95588  ORF Transcript_30599/g.95588 Transcript_30599/m.95588 type:complete len:315 (+) Transcript_30599:604-1548(+)
MVARAVATTTDPPAWAGFGCSATVAGATEGCHSPAPGAAASGPKDASRLTPVWRQRITGLRQVDRVASGGEAGNKVLSASLCCNGSPPSGGSDGGRDSFSPTGAVEDTARPGSGTTDSPPKEAWRLTGTPGWKQRTTGLGQLDRATKSGEGGIMDRSTNLCCGASPAAGGSEGARGCVSATGAVEDTAKPGSGGRSWRGEGGSGLLRLTRHFREEPVPSGSTSPLGYPNKSFPLAEARIAMLGHVERVEGGGDWASAAEGDHGAARRPPGLAGWTSPPRAALHTVEEKNEGCSGGFGRGIGCSCAETASPAKQG